MKKLLGEKKGEYTLIGKCRDTVSQQTVTDYYEKKKKLRTTVVEKETKNKRGNFVLLVGSTIRHKEGYPPLVFDAGIMKVHGKTITSFSAFLPTVTGKEHINIFDLYVQERLARKKIEFFLFKDFAKIPGYLTMLPEDLRKCGFNVQKGGKNLGLIEELRKISFAAYDEVLKLKPSPCPVEKFSDFLINRQSKNEYKVFKDFGMSVPSKVQKAFFTLFAERTEFDNE